VLYSDLTKNLSPHTKHHVSRPYLDDLEEHGRSVADGLGEDLQQRALVVAVDQDPELLGQLVLLLIQLVRAHADLGALVVVVALTI
jgi:predicted ATPase